MFTSDVIEKLQYYVYRLIDPRNGQTFYVGKGKGNRLYAHVNDALKDYDGISYINKDEDDVSSKIQQIRDIRNAGLEVIHIIQRYGLNEKEAFEVEAALIDAFPGLTNIQGGYANDRGVANAQYLQRVLSLEEYTEVDFKYMIIKINDQTLDSRDGNIYETVRSAWKVNLKKVNKFKYILAVLNGVVVGVYEAEFWQNDHRGRDNRYEFIGKEAENDIKNKFINKRIPSKYRKKGMASPVLYHE